MRPVLLRSADARACTVVQSGRQTVAAFGLFSWSFQFNRRKRALGLCVYRQQENGFDHYYVKPVDLAKLLELFKTVGQPAS